MAVLDRPVATTPEPQPTAPERRSVMRPTRHDLEDLGAIAVLSLLALWGFRASFGGFTFLVVGALGLALGLGVAYLGAKLKQPIIVIAAVALVIVVALSGAIALRSTAIQGLIPTQATVKGLGQGFTRGWKELVTTPPPVGTLGYLLAIPYLCGFLSGLLGLTAALRSRRLWWGLVPPTLVLIAGIVTGVAQPVSLVLQGACFFATAIAWGAARAHRVESVPVASTSRRGGRLLVGACLVIAASVIGLVAGPHVWGSEANPRFLLRSYVEPDVQLSQYPSPLTAARLYLQTHANDTVFTVSGLPEGAPIRLAVMDQWDGTSFVVAGTTTTESSGAFRRVGDGVPTTVHGSAAHVDITIDQAFSGVWAPVVGSVSAVTAGGPRGDDLRAAFRYNLATDSALVTTGLQAGDTLSYDVQIPDLHSNLDTYKAASPTQPTNAGAPPALAQTAADLIGDAAGPYTVATRIGEGLAKGFYAPAKGDSARPPGHGYRRLVNFLLTAKPIGDEEQYGATAALMARAANVPTRLVMGFRPGVQSGKPASGFVTVTGKDLSVWLEVDLDGVGWVPVYTVTPPRTQVPDQKPQQREVPKVETQVPPPPPAALDSQPNVADAKASDTGDKSSSNGPLLPQWLVTALLVVGLPLLLLGAFAATILGLKRRRSRQRRSHDDPSSAVTGGWDEWLDRARDHGLRPHPTHTRSEAASHFGAAAPAITDTVPRLAFNADAAAFGPSTPSPEEVAAYWNDVDTAHAALLQDSGFWGRWRARLSLRSLVAPGSGARWGRRPRGGEPS